MQIRAFGIVALLFVPACGAPAPKPPEASPKAGGGLEAECDAGRAASCTSLAAR